MTSYKDSGVDVEAGNKLVSSIKHVVQSTHNENVMDQYGGFAALFRMPVGYKDPVLVSCTDGVGTKLKLAQQYNFHDTIGQDLVAMCINDLYCTGAIPLFFLDYLATAKLDVAQAKQVVTSIANACKIAECALVGGETAEMPGMYHPNDYDLAGFCVGVAELEQIHKPIRVETGHVLIGLGSTGPHSNGYSLIRKLMAEHPMLSDPHLPHFSSIIAPTKIYTIMKTINERHIVSGVAHITGGGLTENIPRMLASNLTFDLDWGPDEWPSLFKTLQDLGSISTDEMLRTFNCGIGMVLAVDPDMVQYVAHWCDKDDQQWFRIGTIMEV